MYGEKKKTESKQIETKKIDSEEIKAEGCNRMVSTDQKLRLQWNDFKENFSSAVGDLRQGQDFTDVTLACEDGQQVEAHKVVLVASSPFFLDILKRNKHPHPLIFMRGVRIENLMAMVDFFYHGEANVYQEHLDSFLILAEELQHLKHCQLSFVLLLLIGLRI